ncbi:hypothetical protein [Nocardia rhamnosiphila]
MTARRKGAGNIGGPGGGALHQGRQRDPHFCSGRLPIEAEASTAS